MAGSGRKSYSTMWTEERRKLVCRERVSITDRWKHVLPAPAQVPGSSSVHTGQLPSAGICLRASFKVFLSSSKPMTEKLAYKYPNSLTSRCDNPVCSKTPIINQSNFPPKGHLAVSGDSFGCHSQGKGSAMDICG